MTCSTHIPLGRNGHSRPRDETCGTTPCTRDRVSVEVEEEFVLLHLVLHQINPICRFYCSGSRQIYFSVPMFSDTPRANMSDIRMLWSSVSHCAINHAKLIKMQIAVKAVQVRKC